MVQVQCQDCWIVLHRTSWLFFNEGIQKVLSLIVLLQMELILYIELKVRITINWHNFSGDEIVNKRLERAKESGING